MSTEPIGAAPSVSVIALQRRAMLSLGATFLVYGVSVGTHLGEFWPFSIFPMFSRAGRPWIRAMMLDVTDAPAELGWGPWSRKELPAPTIPTRRVGASTNDLSKFVQLTRSWTVERVEALQAMWQPALAEQRRLLLLRADGSFGPDGDVSIRFTGLVKLAGSEVFFNPELTVDPKVISPERTSEQGS